MTGPGLEFLLTEPPQATIDGAWSALADRFQVVSDGRQRQVRVWLDTFDGRLRKAGLTLVYVTTTAARPPSRAGRASRTATAAGRTSRTTAGSTGGELRLSTATGTLRQPATLRLPCRLEALPTGPVVDRLRQVVWIRALLPIGTVTSDVGRWRLCNRDDKTVVRAVLDEPVGAGAVLDEPVGAGAEASIPVRLSLTAVRGYDEAAARAARAVAAVAGVQPDPPAELRLLAERGIAAPETGTPKILMRPGGDAAASLAAMLLAQLDVAERNLPGVVDDLDTEFLHDLRVAVRRTRSVLKLAGDVLPGDTAERFAPEFKWLGDLTTPMRDLDVFLLDFDTFAGMLTAADPADLQALHTHLRRQRTAERRRLLTGLRSARFGELSSQWRDRLAEGTLAATRAGSARSAKGIRVGELAQQRIDRAWRRVARRAAAMPADPPAEAVHDLRKRCKELRYVLELFAEVCRKAPYRRVIKDLKTLQDSLGAFQDAEVHRDAVRGYAAAMLTAGTAPAATMLAMGELVARFADEQQRAAAESMRRVLGLVSDTNTRQVARLVRQS